MLSQDGVPIQMNSCFVQVVFSHVTLEICASERQSARDRQRERPPAGKLSTRETPQLNGAVEIEDLLGISLVEGANEFVMASQLVKNTGRKY